MWMMKERELCSAGGCRRSFEKSIVQIVVYEAVSVHVHVEVVLLRHDTQCAPCILSSSQGHDRDGLCISLGLAERIFDCQ